MWRFNPHSPTKWALLLEARVIREQSQEAAATEDMSAPRDLDAHRLLRLIRVEADRALFENR